MRKTVIRQIDGYVENIIEIEEGVNWQPPEGYYLIFAGNGSIGDTWNGTKFIKPSLPVIPDLPDMIALKKYLADPHSGLPDLEKAFQALARLFLGR